MRAKERLARQEEEPRIYRVTLDTVDKPNLQLIMYPGKLAAAKKNGVAQKVSPEAAEDADSEALGGNDEADDRMFETAARVSNVNLGLYRTFVQPFVKAWAREDIAEAMRRAHPLRVQYEMFSSDNPIMQGLHAAMEQHGDNRLIRPESEYTGPSGKRWVPIAER